MAWVEKDPSVHPVPTPCYVQGHQPAAQAADSHIQPGLECLQGWGIHSLLGQPVQCVTMFLSDLSQAVPAGPPGLCCVLQHKAGNGSPSLEISLKGRFCGQQMQSPLEILSAGWSLPFYTKGTD